MRDLSHRWRDMIEDSFLPPALIDAYLAVVAERSGRLWG